MINATVLGNLGRDPEPTKTGSGVRFSVASTGFHTDPETGKGKTVWVSVTAWGKQGENCLKFLKKGSKVLAIGALETWESEGKTGLQMSATTVQFLGGHKESEDKPVFVPEEEDTPF